MIYDVIIAGAGASGLFAAAGIPARRGEHRLILNRAGRPGLKLLMSGSGQCNLTHAGDIREFLAHYGSNGKKIRQLLYQFSNRDLMEWFRQRGLETVTRPDGKVFPSSMDASRVLNLLLQEAEKNGFSLKNNVSLEKIHPAASGCAITVSDPQGQKQTLKCRKLILACGGASYPSTGSDGIIFPVLGECGLSVREPRPCLVPVNVEHYPYAELSGFAVPSAAVRIYPGSQRTRKCPVVQGAVLCTHRNFSGPAVLDSSRYAQNGMTLDICWLPEETEETLLASLNSLRAGCRKQVLTVLQGFFSDDSLSESFLRVLLQRISVKPESRYADLSGEHLKKLVRLLLCDTFTISGTSGFRTAMATAGGLDLSEVDLSTMSLKKFPSVYCIGETLDVDGDTGGYNLQFAFASAHCAARAISGNSTN